MRDCLLMLGGDAPAGLALKLINALRGDELLVIAADHGADHCRALGLPIDLLIGDLDSIEPATAAAAAATSRLPQDKDLTDGEAALLAAIAARPRRLFICGAEGGRPDHALGNLLLLFTPGLPPHTALYGAGSIVYPVRGQLQLWAEQGDTFSLLPFGACHGVCERGCKWELIDAELPPHSSRGLSNIALGPVEISLREGCLLAIHQTYTLPPAIQETEMSL